MGDIFINRNYSYSTNGIKRLDQTEDSQKIQKDSINVGRFDTVDVKKPELILNGVNGGLSSDSFGRGYVNDSQSLDDLKSEFQDEFESLLKSNIDKCRTTLNNKEDIKSILNSVFKDDYFSILNSTLHASVEKGQEWGKGVYYSADDYYMAEDMTNALKDAYNEVCAKYGIEDTTLPDVPYKTYNDWWGQMASGQILLDPSETSPPPVGLEIFYAFDSGKQESAETGNVTVRCGDWSAEQKISFSFMTKNYFSSGSNLAKAWDGNQAVKDYLSNFTFRSNTSAWAYKYDGITPRLNQII